jgi:thiosulfate/3-mercaptopyruvate sulfurtransferase
MSSTESERREVVDPGWISAHLDDPAVRLIEVDVSSAAYDGGHIPGAILWNAYGDLRDRSYVPIGPVELERLLARSGVAPDATIVFYGYGAALGFWLMKAHGHEDVRILVGHRDRWREAGGEWSTEVPAPREGSYRLPAEDPKLAASRQAVEAAIHDPGQLLLDVRSELEFDGERFWPSGASEDVGRAGHVPGAVSVPIDLLVEEGGSPRDSDEMRRVLEERGVTSDKAVIAYCTIGNRASQAWFALSRQLGYPDVRVYYDSWVRWGREPDAPIEP